jgi:hypothetical protein
LILLNDYYKNVEQDVKACAIETEQAHQAQLLINVVQHAKQHRGMCAEDQLQAGQHMALQDL